MSEINQHSPEQEQEEQHQQNREIRFFRSAIEWRRSMVLRMLGCGFRQADIARSLKIHPSTISLDTQFLRVQARNNLKTHIDEKIPMQFMLTEETYRTIIEMAYQKAITSDKTADVLAALSLMSQTTEKLMDHITGGGILEHSVSLVEDRKQKLAEEEHMREVFSQMGPDPEEAEEEGDD